MKRRRPLLLVPCAVALGMSAWAQTAPQIQPAPQTQPAQQPTQAQTKTAPVPQTSQAPAPAPQGKTQAPAAVQSASSAAPPKPAAPEKPKKVSRHDRHEADKAFRDGTAAIVRNDPVEAEKDFERAHELDPGNERYPLSAEIARQFIITQMVQKAAKARLMGHTGESRAVLAQALKLDPENLMVLQHMGELADEAVPPAPTIDAKVDAAPPIRLGPVAARRSFHLRTDEQTLIRQVLNGYGIMATLDSSVKSQTVRFDADDVDFAQAAMMVKLATNTFFVPLDAIHVLVALDTKENRAKYEHQVLETIYFPGLEADELGDMGKVATSIFSAEHAQAPTTEASQNAIVIRAPEPMLAVLNQTYTELLAGRSEIDLDVRMFEVDKSHERNIGVILPNSTTVFNVPTELNSVIANNSSLIEEIISSGLANAGDTEAIVAALIAAGALSGTVFNSPFSVFGGGLTLTGMEVNSASANLLFNASEVRSVDQIRLRAEDQKEATLKTGEKYPIITSSYSSLTPTSSLTGASSLLSSLGLGASSSTASETIPQVQYQDLGLTLKMTPHVENGHEVALKLDLELDSLQGSTINSIPVLNNRQYQGIVSLRPGESALVMSAISKTESREITGIPGLSDIPGLEGATNSDDTVDTTELAIVITPHIVRLAHSQTAGKMMMLPIHP